MSRVWQVDWCHSRLAPRGRSHIVRNVPGACPTFTSILPSKLAQIGCAIKTKVDLAAGALTSERAKTRQTSPSMHLRP